MIMRGKLLKRSDIFRTWKMRTFELDTGLLVRTLRYFDQNGKLKGELVLNGKKCVIQLLDESTSGRPHCFALTASGRSIIMSAGSDSSMRKWVDFLEKNGATLLGTEDVEQQELWRSVMEAEAKIENEIQIEQQNNSETSSSIVSDGARSSCSAFSENSSVNEPIQTTSVPLPRTSEESTGEHSFSSGYEPSPIDGIVEQVHNRMISMGMYKESLPSSSAISQCQIFMSEDWSSCDKLIIFIGNSNGGGGSGVPPGIWSRSGCSFLGIEDGSMLSYLERAQEGGYGCVVLDTSTHSNLVYMDGKTEKIPVKGSETASRHISFVWNKFISNADAESVFVIAYGLGGECFKEFLESNTHLLFSGKTPHLKALCLLDSSHQNDGITQETVRRFLRQRAINWHGCESTSSNLKKTNEKNEESSACVCISAGTNPYDDETSTNPAWIIPVVKYSVFHFMDFCADIDDSIDVGGFYTDRWCKMETQVHYS